MAGESVVTRVKKQAIRSLDLGHTDLRILFGLSYSDFFPLYSGCVSRGWGISMHGDSFGCILLGFCDICLHFDF